MVSGEIVATAVLSIVFLLIAAYIAIAFILPMVRSFVKEIIEDTPAVNGFMSILVIVVYILLFKKILEILVAMPQTAEDGSRTLAGYLGVLQPGALILDQLLPFIGWVLLGGLIAFGLKHYFKK